MNPITVLFAVIISALAVPAVYMVMSSQQQQELSTAAAIQMARVEKAAEAYITANAGAIESVATGSSPAVITVPMLESTGYLPNGFTSVNPFGQTWEVQVLQPTSGNLQALVVSYGGNTVKAKVAGQVAQIAGASGGVIGGGSGEYAVPGCTGGEACGSYNGWSVTTSGYQNIQPGHFAALLAYSNGQLQSDYLYRVAVPGQPQLNTMQTNLNMGTNSVNNANEVNAQSETLAGGQPNGQPGALQIGSNYYYGDSSNAAVRTPGSFYIQNQNGSGPAQIAEVSNVWGSGELEGGYVNSTGDVNAQYNSTANNAFAMDNGSWWANNAGDSSQSGNAYVGGQVTANYDARLGTANGTANQNWGCSEYGEIAASASGNGQAMMCNGSSWQPIGGNNAPLQMYSEDLPSGQIFPGQWQFCAVTDGFDAWVDIYPIAGPYSNGTYTWGTGDGKNGYATIFTCYNLPGVYVPSNP
ncbi:shufflon system plasmid conjugative transfer pilus tip adhesin PilV [Acidithiobacillus sulfurivorans]|uniref:Shufflon system plasmid conjugative transfer pilus tip adhesin PilV n=1 Tax=Acidithiobacillus sulfurivorans TaxID=1958756 RepID=A0ABS5ZWL3_9PROT|nr:shufflon system plasmid conjugative transfer pilus tip adhesin PilV [Acidithiobacillus sulfurivorans]MBU2758835.1 shufflon system plasmid conjugative transfer pilus tip adhesin PilV [Acidithiobacillus sulfurivorans]